MNVEPIRPVDADDVLALLEDGPHSTTQLATWCATTTKAMTVRLTQLAVDGKVARDHQGGQWHRVVPKPPLPIVDPDVVLHQLQFAPKTETALLDELAVPLVALRLTLARLAGQGVIKPIGKLSALRWALAGWTADLPQSARPQKRSTPADPGAREAQGSTSGQLSPADFAARTAKPPKAPAVDGEGQSWWTKHADPALPREAFTRAARQRDAEMRESSTAWRSPKPVNTFSLS